jgi:hypothetical protein
MEVVVSTCAKAVIQQNKYASSRFISTPLRLCGVALPGTAARRVADYISGERIVVGRRIAAAQNDNSPVRRSLVNASLHHLRLPLDAKEIGLSNRYSPHLRVVLWPFFALWTNGKRLYYSFVFSRGLSINTAGSQ